MIKGKTFIPAIVDAGGSPLNKKLNFIPVSSTATVGSFGATDSLTYIPEMNPSSNRLHLNYIPAEIEGVTNFSRKNEQFIPADILSAGHDLCNYTKKEYKLSWWETNSFFYYPSILISSYYGMKYQNLREKYNMPKELLIMGDSGGFQNLTLNANLNPLEVLEWQEKNCDIGFILDYPLLNIPKEEINNIQEKTVRNAHLALNNKDKNSKMKLYGVIQGKTYEQQEKIINMYKEKNIFDKFDGFGIGSLDSKQGLNNITSILTSFFVHFRDYKKPLHLFGISGRNATIIIHYLGNKFKKYNFTFDSASYGSGALRMEFTNYFNNFFIDFGRNNKLQIKNMPCQCPICSVITIQDIIKGGSLSGALLSLHNLYSYLQYEYFIKMLSEDINLFREYILKNTKINAKLLDFIDLTIEKDYQTAYEKYLYLFKPQSQGNQTSINF